MNTFDLILCFDCFKKTNDPNNEFYSQIDNYHWIRYYLPYYCIAYCVLRVAYRIFWWNWIILSRVCTIYLLFFPTVIHIHLIGMHVLLSFHSMQICFYSDEFRSSNFTKKILSFHHCSLNVVVMLCSALICFALTRICVETIHTPLFKAIRSASFSLQRLLQQLQTLMHFIIKMQIFFSRKSKRIEAFETSAELSFRIRWWKN